MTRMKAGMTRLRLATLARDSRDNTDSIHAALLHLAAASGPWMTWFWMPPPARLDRDHDRR